MSNQERKPLGDILNEYADDLQSVTNWCARTYDENFSFLFDNVKSLHDKLQTEKDKITDDDLEMILTDLPLALFSASEKLNGLRTTREVGKLKLKEKKLKKKEELYKAIQDKNSPFSKSDIPSLINDSFIDDQVMQVALDGVINRVENEISFTRELIMSAKKIWDRRSSTDVVNPVGPIVPEYQNLPDYGNFEKTEF